MLNTPILARITEFVKDHEIQIILGVGVVLISLLSFAIGYLTAKEQLKEPLRMEQTQAYGTGG
ncbi:MAG TPA: hypothetical protein VFE94_02880 [Candidatus Paceibacterota bacterium]|nr:hypothetical protein [Candidatus Paceibacterota bacterium]